MIVIPYLGEVTTTVSKQKTFVIIEIGDGSTEVCSLKVFKSWVFFPVTI